ncbi:MAG: two-component regulator propeller domain-containing protein [bacterium]
MKVFQYDPSDSATLSDNRITNANCIVEDEEGKLWVGTFNGLNRYDPVTGKFTRFKHNPDKEGTISNSTVTCLYKDRSGTIWVGVGGRAGLNRYEPTTQSFTVYPDEHDDSMHIANIMSMLEDSQGNFWIGSSRGLYLFDREKHLFQPIGVSEGYPEISSRIICRTLHEDIDGMIMIGTKQGFMYYDSALRQIRPFQELFHPSLVTRHTDYLPGNKDPNFTHWVIHLVGIYGFNKYNGHLARVLHDPSDPYSILGVAMNSIFRDETGLLWIPSDFGVNILDPDGQSIRNYKISAGRGYNSTCFYEDKRGRIWKGSGILEMYNMDMNFVRSYPHFKQDPDSTIFTGDIWSILEDSHKNIWVGNDFNGLFLLRNDEDALVSCDFSRPDVNFVYDIFEDSRETLWVGTDYGLFYRKKNDHPISYFYSKDKWGILNLSGFSTVILDIEEDKAGNLWIGTFSKGLFYQPADSSGTDYFLQLLHDQEYNFSLSDNTIWSIHEDEQGDLWFATENGLNKRLPDENKFIRYFSKTDLGANFIYDLTSDNNGYLWLNTASGVYSFKPDPCDSCNSASGSYLQLLPFQDVFPYRIFKSRSGHIFIGGAYNKGKGYYRFHPDSLHRNNQVPPVAITGIKVNNKPYPTDTSSVWKKHLILNYDQNFFSIESAVLDYYDPESNQYAYYLEGFDKQWLESGQQRIANYTDVPPGNYIFHVKGANNNKVWNEAGASLAITILPPPWKTWWAYLIYGIAGVGLLLLILRFYLNRLKLYHQLELEKVEAKKMKELDSLKSRFFANISHEFRTPLTLILGPVEKLLADLTGEYRDDLAIIKRNAQRLEQLINELLTLSKLEAGQLKLQAREMDLVNLVNGYVQSFESLAKQRNIDLTFASEKDEIQTFVDPEKLEKILNNLLSNAFKFTPDGGSVKVGVSVEKHEFTDNTLKETPEKNINIRSNFAVIYVSDSGHGIEKHDLQYIFNRYFQSASPATHRHKGEGIGLALTKELVELHRGEIRVESIPGKGSTFIIYIPLGKKHLNEAQISHHGEAENDGLTLPVSILNEHQEIFVDKGETSETKPIVLLIEDNDDLRKYLLKTIGKPYHIIEARDGEEGLKRAFEIVPDLIISDVMMPKMDGFEVCTKLKSDERTSHIPVILLTARAGTESRIEGLETGVDAYMTKPFEATELQVRIRNLLLQRQRIRESLLNKMSMGNVDEIFHIPVNGLKEMDRQFLIRAFKLVETHLTDTDFDITTFCREMALSRSQLHRKLHSIINLSASEFIRLIRLNKAARLLKTGKATVSEIAYETGFNTLSYFTRCFRKQFGVTPSDYTNSNN